MDIQIGCKTEHNLDWRILKPLQGELKSLSQENYQKLKNEIVKTKFAFPIFVWQSGADVFIVGGHQRVRCVKQMVEQEGYTCATLPCIFIEAANKKEAMRRVLQDVAQYGRIEGQGLYEFMHEAELGIEELLKEMDLPNIDMANFAVGFFGTPEKNLADGSHVLDAEDFNNLGHTCPKCGFEFEKDK